MMGLTVDIYQVIVSTLIGFAVLFVGLWSVLKVIDFTQYVHDRFMR